MRWEYKFVEFGPINTVHHVFKVDDVPFHGKGPETIRTRFCQQLGLDGWEMVNISFEIGGSGPQKSIAVFKRLLSDSDAKPQNFPWPQSSYLP